MAIVGAIDIFENFTALDAVVAAMSLAGLALLINWFVNYSGPQILATSPVRRNRIPPSVPFFAMVIWMFVAISGTAIPERLFANAQEWVLEFYNYLWMAIVELVLLVALLYFAKAYFARGLKGMGFDLRTVVTDLKAGTVNLVAVYPLVIAGILLMALIGKLIWGPDFQMETSEGLVAVTSHPQLSLRILLFVFVVLIVPVFEEVLFRGFLQSMVRGYVQKPWVAIALTSLIFTSLHPSTHWLGVFMLSCGMGYAYERSGSMFRSIFMHMLFNGLSMTATLLSG
ncbi:hypothetical protein LCGC14_2839670 [marine sediment metagenome]|uniref:CAAX prenyl protease 2/Lysostaphin resistance protein A-like domain-containing protein n=1 Tax=marine sediment metagenome TaxID=412755 RepID=A0A0F8YY74_9ZZZZ